MLPRGPAGRRPCSVPSPSPAASSSPPADPSSEAADWPSMARIPAERVVPGHGPLPVPWPDALAPQRAYLEGLVTQIRTLQRQLGTIQQAVDTVGRDAADQWLLFDEYHSRNVTAAFAELEWE